MHVFPYSPRKGTKAAVMPNQIQKKVKEERSKKLISLSNQNEKEYLEEFIGKRIEVLFEQEEEEYIKGHTANYIEVKIPKDKAKENDIKCVKLLKREGLSLIGDVT